MNDIFLVSRFPLMHHQIGLVSKFLSTPTGVLDPQMLRLHVALAKILRAERLRAVRADEALLSVDHRHGGRPVEILQQKKIRVITQHK